MKKLIRLLILTNILVIVFLAAVFILLFDSVTPSDDYVRSRRSTSNAVPSCPEWQEPIESVATISNNSLVTLFYTLPYSENPANCFKPHPNEDGWFLAGRTKIRIGTGDPDIEDNTWLVYDEPTIREWDGTTIVIGDIIDLHRMGSDFLKSWDAYDRDQLALFIEMHLEDLEGNSTVLKAHGGDCSSFREGTG